MTLLSYKNSEKLKADFLKEIQKHKKLDAIEQGTYGKMNGNWKGCAVACSLRSLAILDGEELVTEYNNHKLYETKLGIPEWLARLEDTIFEGLPEEDAKKWVGQFSRAIPVGLNLEPIKYKFSAFILKENIDRVLKLKIDDELKEKVVKAIRGVLVLHERAIKTGRWNEEATRSAAESAESAAQSAESAWSARLAAQSATRSAAQSATRSAAKSAWSAAQSAESAWSAAESAESAAESAESAWSARLAAQSATRSAAKSAWSAAYKKYAKHLLKLLKEIK